MNEIELKDNLISLQNGISEADANAITDSLKRLDLFLEANRSALSPQLRHFLERRSYQKALMYLEGRSDIPKGICSGKGE